jgi:hypothetical protein
MKKCLLWAACLLAIALAACSKGSDEAAAPASDAAAASAPLEAASDAGAAASNAALAASDFATAVASAEVKASSGTVALSPELASRTYVGTGSTPVVTVPASAADAAASSTSTTGASAGAPAPSPSPPPSTFASVNEARASMISGHLVFNVPTPVDIDETCPCRIDAVLGAAQSVLDLQKLITLDNPQATNLQSAQVQMSNQMIARLTADPDDFTIDPRGDQEQAVSSQMPTTWSWTVTPNRWGRHTLQLVIEAVVTVEGHSEPVLLTTLDKPIQVTVTPWGRIRRFAADNWKWAWTAIFVPIAGWIWSRFKRKLI